MREWQSIAVERVEIAHVAIEPAWKNRARIGVDFFCAEQGGDRVEISVFVCKDSIHETEL